MADPVAIGIIALTALAGKAMWENAKPKPKPCPACGGSGRTSHQGEHLGNGVYKTHYRACGGCGGRGQVMG